MPKRHFAIEEVKDERNIDIPIMVWNDYDASGRTLSGQTVEAFWFQFHIFPC
jgi:5-methyltetrahydrofolate--homocysteine methyltransferase